MKEAVAIEKKRHLRAPRGLRVNTTPCHDTFESTRRSLKKEIK